MDVAITDHRQPTIGCQIYRDHPEEASLVGLDFVVIGPLYPKNFATGLGTRLDKLQVNGNFARTLDCGSVLGLSSAACLYRAYPELFCGLGGFGWYVSEL